MDKQQPSIEDPLIPALDPDEPAEVGGEPLEGSGFETEPPEPEFEEEQ